MGHSEGGSHFRGPGAGLGERKAALVQNAIEGLAVQEFHDQIRRLCGFVDAHIVERNDRRMGQLADDARFLDKALARFTLGPLSGQELDSDQAADHGIVSASDPASSSGADDF